MERSGWSVDISGAAARLVNYTLWKEYGLNESSWEPSMQGKVSIEAPYMLKLLGLRSVSYTHLTLPTSDLV